MINLRKYCIRLCKELLILINNQLKFLALFCINFYKTFLSNYFGNGCRFIPSCSDYGKSAFQSQSFLRACWLILRRLMKCRPGGACGYDPVPPRKDVVSE